MKIKPFKALRPTESKARLLASVPYDVVDTAEARALAQDNPESFLHVSRPEIDLPDSIDIYDDRVYAQGVRALQDLIRRGTLIREESPRLYVYRQVMGSHSQTGVVACCSIDDYAQNVIRRHEKTRKDKEDDRTRYCLDLNANTGPVFLTYRDRTGIDTKVREIQGEKPLYDFTAEDGIRHTVWAVSEQLDAWVEEFSEIPLAYVADGHHRAAAAFRTGELRRAAHPGFTGKEAFNWFLAVLFPASQLKILPYNRCVADLNGMTPGEFLERVRAIFKTEAVEDAEPRGGREVRMYLDHRWYALSWEAFEADPVSRLDVSVLQDRLLAPLLAIEDPRTDRRISFIGGIRGTDELQSRVDSGKAAVAFSLYPVTVGEMIDIADAGQIMPPKSTWFEPKLRSGLLIHELE